VSGWGLQETEISAAPWALRLGKGLYFYFLLTWCGNIVKFTFRHVESVEALDFLMLVSEVCGRLLVNNNNLWPHSPRTFIQMPISYRNGSALLQSGYLSGAVWRKAESAPVEAVKLRNCVMNRRKRRASALRPVQRRFLFLRRIMVHVMVLFGWSLRWYNMVLGWLQWPSTLSVLFENRNTHGKKLYWFSWKVGLICTFKRQDPG